MKKTTNILIAIAVIIIAVVILNFTVFNSNSIKIKIGSKYDKQMQLTEDKTKFKLGEVIYYSASSKGKISKNMDITIKVQNQPNKQSIQKENFKIKSGTKFVRPINPVQVDKKGKYKIEVLDGNKVLDSKEIEVE